ncbi:hypothetical protein NA56DRAFT_748226 [Hyaloscypha hepaticicola]|uniref:Uncharacterized protein n=1 Tax=Hyaloscypha hepaticicola TaxID=2082293 RepID=A0A2J6Q6L0_9HELO|nr:hypothetical protein NA56DRAFT_748226 [Hyaloscypha hepaticicola]
MWGSSLSTSRRSDACQSWWSCSFPPLMDVAAVQVFDAISMGVCSLHGSRLFEAEFSFASTSRVPSLFLVFRPEAETHRPLDGLTILRARICTSSIGALLETWLNALWKPQYVQGKLKLDGQVHPSPEGGKFPADFFYSRGGGRGRATCAALPPFPGCSLVHPRRTFKRAAGVHPEDPLSLRWTYYSPQSVSQQYLQGLECL